MAKHGRMAGMAAGLMILAATVEAGAQPRVERLSERPVALTLLPATMHGRFERKGAGFVRQWPGSYAETAFRGSAVSFDVGPSEVALHVRVDGRRITTLVKPVPGLYRVAGMPAGRHVLRIEVASESQSGPTGIGPFFAERGTVGARLRNRTRQIELVGDSHTVGYGVTSPKRECTQDEVWATTDTSRGFGALLARRYGADYAVNAISGRGVVRNYGGFAADTLPEAYPFTLFDHRSRANATGWHPQVIVVSLGTNDFTTPLHAGETWTSRDALHGDYERRYVRFVQELHARDPRAQIVLWATDMANGEIQAEVAKVAATLRTSGAPWLTYVPVNGLSFSGCHSHPSIADQTVIADRIAAVIDARVAGWARRS
ncbi:SGNH/GDSL hydrolase family protein [Sphingomonas sp. BK481]|uniref:SGNH/GDSL hydrolase family protein n=1 Tax=Sphingomonas sp. BK481 TaxID=2586981 RepID=UPI0017A595AB|nr:SGNH/GDSL hydrolase family protein [Sphingomonas sp. BK481]MBB3588184.1 lysophospholipase L1-like esterase [Sphingomonas sp. BK481]